MGVGENHGIDRARVEGEAGTVACLVRGRALDQAAVDEHLPLAATHQKAGTGDLPGGAVELYFHFCAYRNSLSSESIMRSAWEP